MKSPLKIGEKIRIVRSTTGLSQANMGTQLGISQQAYQQLEEGKTIMTETRLTEIANILDVTEQEIRDVDKIPIINKNLKHCHQFGNFKPVYYNEKKSDENVEKDKEVEELKGEVSILKSMISKLMQKLGVGDEENLIVS
jgi:transcriptional regulator with XRE-family HTH domain